MDLDNIKHIHCPACGKGLGAVFQSWMPDIELFCTDCLDLLETAVNGANIVHYTQGRHESFLGRLSTKLRVINHCNMKPSGDEICQDMERNFLTNSEDSGTVEDELQEINDHEV